MVLMLGLMVYRGLLVPRSTYLDVIAERDRLREVLEKREVVWQEREAKWQGVSEEWREAFLSSQRIKDELVRQNTQLIGSAERAVQGTGGGSRNRGEMS